MTDDDLGRSKTNGAAAITPARGGNGVNRRDFAAVTGLAMLAGVSSMARAQEFPSAPVRIITGFSAGGSTDVVARLLAQRLSVAWSQPVVVENRVGAAGIIGTDHVAKSKPDGHTLLVGDISTNAIAKSLYPRMPFDPVNDLIHVTRLVSFPLVLLVPPNSSILTLADLLAQARARPGQLRYSSGGAGSSPHVFLEMINQMAGIKTEAIHYKGGPPAMNALLAGEVDYSLISISTGRGLIQSGKARAIAVTSAQSTPSLPNVPPVRNVVAGYQALSFHGLHAPAGTPAAIVAKIQRDTAAAMERPEIKDRLAEASSFVSIMTTEEFTAYIKQQTDQWAEVVKVGKIVVE